MRPAALLLLALPASAAQLALTDAGLSIDAGTMGRFTLSYPVLNPDAGPSKPIEVRLDGPRATLRYASGSIDLELAGDTVSLTFRDLPREITRWRMETLIDFGYSEGGRWQIGGATGAFPATQPETPFLFQGHAASLQLTDPLGQRLTITVPEHSFQQLQDNREWNWKIFAWFAMANLDPANPRAELRITQAAPTGPAPGPMVDRFGQDTRLDFPGKVTDEQELRDDIARDEAYYAAQTPRELDEWGGLPGSRERLGLTATGYFHVEQAGGRWHLVDPAGNTFFHLGICGFQPSDDYTYIKGREPIYAWLPPYDGEFRTAFHADAYWSRDTFSFYLANVIRKYGAPYEREAWTARMIDRVRRLGFNSGGAFSPSTAAHRERRFPYVSSLPLSEWQLGGQIAGLRGLFDPFDPAIAAKMEALFAEHIAPRADEPLIIGYFLANEQAFEDIPRVIPSLPAESHAKRALVALLRERYATIGELNAAWGTAFGSFDALAAAGLPVTTQAAADDLAAFVERFIEAYFRLVRDTFRRHDANHLLLGNRWQPRTANHEALCRIAGRYCDVISVNYYTYALDAGFLRRLDDWAGGRPMLLSEFYWASPSDTGLPGGNEVTGQRERGLAYRNYVEQAAALPFVVGIEWFTLIDQARSGRWFERYTGEKANTGLFSVTDRPYRTMLAEATVTNAGIYEVLFGERPPFQFDHPRFRLAGPSGKVIKVPRATGPITLDGRRDDWPGIPAELIPGGRLVLGADETGFEAGFMLCWDETHLYLLATVSDPTPGRNGKSGADLWNGDGLELFCGHEALEADGPLRFGDRQILLGAGAEPAAHVVQTGGDGGVRLVVAPSVDGTGYALEAAIPFATLGFTPSPELSIRFDVAIDDSATGAGRERQLMWNGTARNSSDRTAWGRAVLVE